MGKRKDKKNRRIETGKNTHTMRSPKDFFRNIGIKPEGSGNGEFEDLEKAILKRNNPKLVEGFNCKKGSFEHFFHDDLDLVKLFYGAQYKHLYKIAEELARLPVPPKSRVLDVGGGPGHLAFWMAKIWDSPVTVADKYSDLGEQWAKEIRVQNVIFVETLLPDLKPLKNGEYDIVVLSRALNFILQEALSSNINNFSTRDYLDSLPAKELIDRIEGLIEGAVRVLSPEGKIVVVESWSDARVLLIAEAFERKGLFVDLDFFSHEWLGRNFSVIAFSRSLFPTHIKNPSLALAAVVNFGNIECIGGWVAELIRSFFKVSPTMLLEYTSGDERGVMLYEILEQEGLVLGYVTSTTGLRSATLCPATETPRLVENLKKLGQEVEDQNDIKITRQFLAEINNFNKTQDEKIEEGKNFEDENLNQTIEDKESATLLSELQEGKEDRICIVKN